MGSHICIQCQNRWIRSKPYAQRCYFIRPIWMRKLNDAYKLPCQASNDVDSMTKNDMEGRENASECKESLYQNQVGKWCRKSYMIDPQDIPKRTIIQKDDTITPLNLLFIHPTEGSFLEILNQKDTHRSHTWRKLYSHWPILLWKKVPDPTSIDLINLIWRLNHIPQTSQQLFKAIQIIQDCLWILCAKDLMLGKLF
jgi:hypothetical protein